MSSEMVYGIAGTVTVLCLGTAAVIGLRWAWEWWKSRPASVQPATGTLERLRSAAVLWLCALGVWAASSAVIHYAPRSGLYGELLFGLPELLGLVTFASRAAWGALVAAGVDAGIWPLFGPRVILNPPEGSIWRNAGMPLRAVGLGGWMLLYIVIMAGAMFGIEPVYDTVAPAPEAEARPAVEGAVEAGR